MNNADVDAKQQEKKKELLKVLSSWVESFDGPYTIKEYRAQGLKPSYSTVIKYFGSWTKALHQTDAQQPTKEKLLENLRNWVKYEDGPYTKEKYRLSRKHPSINSYVKVFGSWTKSIESAKIKKKVEESIKQLYQRYDEKFLLDNLREWAKSFSGPYSTIEYRKQGLSPSISLYYYHFGSWINALKKAGLITENVRTYKFTKESILDSLKKWAETYNGPLTSIEFSKQNRSPSLGTIHYYFDSWENAMESAGLKELYYNSTNNYTEEETINTLVRWKQNYGGPYTVQAYKKSKLKPSAGFIINYFGKWNIALNKAGIRNNPEQIYTFLSDEQIILSIKEWFNTTEGPKTSKVYQKNIRNPSYSTLVNKFGSWKKALKAANLDQ